MVLLLVSSSTVFQVDFRSHIIVTQVQIFDILFSKNLPYNFWILIYELELNLFRTQEIAFRSTEISNPNKFKVFTTGHD